MIRTGWDKEDYTKESLKKDFYKNGNWKIKSIYNDLNGQAREIFEYFFIQELASDDNKQLKDLVKKLKDRELECEVVNRIWDVGVLTLKDGVDKGQMLKDLISWKARYIKDDSKRFIDVMSLLIGFGIEKSSIYQYFKDEGNEEI
jgi:hypothetical protein